MRAEIPVRFADPHGQRRGIHHPVTARHEAVHERRRGEIAGGASPDAVGHSGAPGRDERRVLVDVTVSADVAVDTGRQTEGHRREESSAQRAKYPR